MIVLTGVANRNQIEFLWVSLGIIAKNIEFLVKIDLIKISKNH
jgi:hypothetical protein